MSGFPPGLEPATWMGDFIKRLNPERKQSFRVTDFVLPGSHDCATYGEGIEDFSYQCQNKTLYEQMMTGQRFFDLRVAPEKDKKKFIPVHGIAKHTAHDFNQGPNKREEKDLATQIFKFAREHPSEIIVVKVTLELEDEEMKHLWAETAWNLLGERLLQSTEQVPTYHHAVESNRNIILAFAGNQAPQADHQIKEIFWATGQVAWHWLGEGNPALWNEPTWQSGKLDQVLASTEDWMRKNADRLAKKDKFWVAQLQLTPALGQGISTFIKDGASIRPKDLALGGGSFGTGLSLPGHSKEGTNKQLREGGVLKKPFWKNHASILQYDFADTETTGAIVAMNLKNP